MKKPCSRRLQLESLETRDCPSSLNIQGATLFIQGDSAANSVTVTDNGQGTISATVDGQSITGSGISKVVIKTFAGDDVVDYRLTGFLQKPEQLSITLGGGNDRAFLDYSLGLAARLNVSLTGNGGNDQVGFNLGDAANRQVNFTAALGNGDDTFTATLSGNIQNNARVRITANGNQGNDSLNLVGTGINGINVDTAALLAVTLDGGMGFDSSNVNYQGQVNGNLQVNVYGRKQADTMLANLTVNLGSSGWVDASVRGNQGADELTFNVYDNSNGGVGTTLSRLNAWIGGGLGMNTLAHNYNVEVQ